WQSTGKPLSAWQTQWSRDACEVEPPEALPRILCLDLPRPQLHARINSRVEAMLAAGWLDEVRRLRTLPKPLSREAAQALGYRELFEHLDGQADLTTTVARIQARSR